MMCVICFLEEVCHSDAELVLLEGGLVDSTAVEKTEVITEGYANHIHQINTQTCSEVKICAVVAAVVLVILAVVVHIGSA